MRMPLAFHLRGHRQFYGQTPLSQKEFAELSGLPAWIVRRYEKSRRLPVVFEQILRLALALNVPVNNLVAPHVLDPIVDEISTRRRAFASRKYEGSGQ